MILNHFLSLRKCLLMLGKIGPTVSQQAPRNAKVQAVARNKGRYDRFLESVGMAGEADLWLWFAQRRQPSRHDAPASPLRPRHFERYRAGAYRVPILRKCLMSASVLILAPRLENGTICDAPLTIRMPPKTECSEV